MTRFKPNIMIVNGVNVLFDRWKQNVDHIYFDYIEGDPQELLEARHQRTRFRYSQQPSNWQGYLRSMEAECGSSPTS